MSTPTFKSFRNNQIISKWEVREINPSVLGMEFQVPIGDDCLKGFVEFLEEWKNNILSKTDYKDEYEEKYYEKLKKEIEGAKPKITIKIELEKYEKQKKYSRNKKFKAV